MDIENQFAKKIRSLKHLQVSKIYKEDIYDERHM